MERLRPASRRAGGGGGAQANLDLWGEIAMFGFFIELIGEEATAKLIERFGGTRLYVPHSPTPDDALAQAVGVESALKLAQTFGGERVEVPKPPPRPVRILALRAAGHSVESIARALGCTRRRVFQVLAEARRAAHSPAACAAPRPTPPPRALGRPR
jgi:hypothetical protein